MGNSGPIILSIIYACIATVFFCGTKSWLPIKICAIVAELFELIKSCMWSHIMKLYDTYNVTDDYYILDKVQEMSSCYDNVTILTTLLFVVSLVLTIVWLNKKPMAPSIHNKPIDLI